MAVSFHSVHSV
jgi:hypothetical protein